MKAERIQPTKQETEQLRIDAWQTVNAYDPHSKLQSSEMRAAINVDIFPGFIKARRGSEQITGLANKLANEQVLHAIHWDTGTKEYAIIQTLNGSTSKFWYWELATGTPAALYLKDTTTQFTLTLSTAAEMFVSKNQLYGFSTAGNFIIEWDGTSAFFKRQMGLPLPVWAGTGTSSGGTEITGTYAYGIEFVYRQGANTFDSVASTPNRRGVSGAIQKIVLNAQRAIIDIAAPSDPLYTHVRLWRSKRLDASTDGVQFLDVVGLETELYPVELVTKANITNGAGYTNAAGISCAQYRFIDSYTDEQLPVAAAGAWYTVNDITRIELKPVSDAAARIGTYHRSRIWFAGVSNDSTQSRAYYSNYAGTPYSEQFDAFQFRDIDSGDGQQVTKLISYEKDLVALKEAKTCVLVDGDPVQSFEVRDHKIGCTDKKAAQYIPGIGICAITNDQGDFKVFGYDQRWSSNIGGVEVGRGIRPYTSVMDLTKVSFLYLNGKFWICDGVSGFWVLHVENGAGWTKYEYPMNSYSESAFVWANGSRGAVISRNTYIVEIDKASVNTDRNTADDSADDYYIDVKTHQFQADNGRVLLDFHNLSVTADLTDALIGTPYVNGLPWPNGTTLVPINFVIDPNTYAAHTELKQSEYRFYAEPPRPIGNYLHFRLYTKAPATIHSAVVTAILDKGSFLNFDPFQFTAFQSALPSWGGNVILHLPFDETSGDTAHDISGNARHHTWEAGSPAGSHAYDATLAPGGGQAITAGTGSAYGDADWTALDLLLSTGYLSDAITFEWVVTVTSLAAVIIMERGGDGSNYWGAKINTDGSLQFDGYLFDSTPAVVVNKKFTTAAGTISTGQYIIQFTWSNGGLNGQFYSGLKSGSMSTNTTTTEALV